MGTDNASGVNVKAGWINAFRPRTLTGAVIPVLLGAIFAAYDGHFSWWLLLLTLLAGILIQAGSNLINTYGDFKSGVDTVASAEISPELVTGALTAKQVYIAGIICFALTALIGLVFVFTSGLPILIIGLVGIAAAYGYTAGVSYKYLSLGLVMVFIMMGLLMVLGSYYVQASAFRWDLLLIALPNAFLITSVLSGNELRDFYFDLDSGILTLSGRLGYHNSHNLYRALLILPYLFVIGLIIGGIYPIWTLLTFITLPVLYKAVKNSNLAVAGDKRCNMLLVPMAFTLHWQFGVLLIIGCLLGFWF